MEKEPGMKTIDLQEDLQIWIKQGHIKEYEPNCEQEENEVISPVKKDTNKASGVNPMNRFMRRRNRYK
jgi:hypothetical protein